MASLEVLVAWSGCCAVALAMITAQADDISSDSRGVLRLGWWGVRLVDGDVAPSVVQLNGQSPIDPARWDQYRERCRKASDTIQAAVDRRMSGGMDRASAINQTRYGEARLVLAELRAAVEEMLVEPVTGEQKSAIIRRAWVRSIKTFALRDYLHAPLCMDTGLWLAERQVGGESVPSAESVAPGLASQLADRALQLRTDSANQRMEDWRRWGPLSPGDPGHAKALAAAADYRRVAAWRKCQLEWLDAAAVSVAKGGDPLAAELLRSEFLAQENPDFLGSLQFYRTLVARASPDDATDPAAFATWRLAAMAEHNQLSARFVEESLEAIAAARSTWPPTEAGLPRLDLAQRLGESLSTMETRHGEELLALLKPEADSLRADVKRLAAERYEQEWNGWRLALDMTRQMITAERVELPPPGAKPGADGQPAPADGGK